MTVYLVGAGTGAADLLTCRARRLLESADLVVHDAALAPLLDEVAREACERSSDPALERLVERARAGKRVVRLLRGDPLLSTEGVALARGLRAAEVPFEVVPGLPFGLTAASFAGVPLAGASLEIDRETVIIEGRIGELERAVERLLAGGRSLDDRAILVERPGMPSQRVSVARLGEVIAREPPFERSEPVALIVGAAALRRAEVGAWLEERPLHGRTVVVLRSPEQAGELVQELRELGALVLEIPMLAFAAPRDEQPLLRALAELSTYDWVGFTSPNGVEAVLSRLRAQGRDARAFGGARVAVIGPGTGERVRDFGLLPDLVATESVGEGLLADLVKTGVRGKRVLLPRADIARPALAEGLEAAGAAVTSVVAYRTIEGAGDAGFLRKRLEERAVDVVCFTSSSTVRHLARRLGDRELVMAFELGPAIAASLGPITSTTLRELGIEPAVEAREHTVAGLVRALREKFGAAARPRQGSGETERL